MLFLFSRSLIIVFMTPEEHASPLVMAQVCAFCSFFFVVKPHNR